MNILKKIIKNVIEGLIFLLVTIFLFNEISQTLQILGLFTIEQIKNIGSISILLALDNLLSKRFLGLKLFN